MEEHIIEILRKYQGQQVEFAITFEKSGGTLPQQLIKLFEEEYQRTLRKEKEKFINELEQMILVYNNVVLLSHLKELRDNLEKESK